MLGTSGEITGTTVFDEFGADSLDTVEIIMELEEEFGVSIPLDVAKKLRTVADVVRYIQSKS